jgi:hypothetical protein
MLFPLPRRVGIPKHERSPAAAGDVTGTQFAAHSQERSQYSHVKPKPIKEGRTMSRVITTEDAALAATGETPEAAKDAAPAAAGDNQTQLQDILPTLNDLAKRVGGMKQLAALVNDLAQPKE